MEIPIKMDDLGGKPTIFGNIHVKHAPLCPFPKRKELFVYKYYCKVYQPQKTSSGWWLNQPL